MSVTTQTTTLATIPSGTAISTTTGDGGIVQVGPPNDNANIGS